MERQLFSLLYEWLLEVGRTHARGYKQFSDHVIVAVLLWAVLHDRPVFWACQEINWPPGRGFLLTLPSPATMSRRLRSYPVLLLLEQLASLVRDLFPKSLLKVIDSKPLPVSAVTKDKDARRGYAAGSFAKGYKLFVLMDACGIQDGWRLEPMPAGESVVGQKLVLEHPGSGYVLADANYDTRGFYQSAGQAGFQGIVQPRYPKALKRYKPHQSPFRNRGLELSANALAVCGQTSSFGQDLLDLRDTIERRLGYLTSFGGGLAPLPSWVRRPHRVALWIHAKLLIAAARDIKAHRHLHAR